MESGYVNEGGQLTTRNGKKYVFNRSLQKSIHSTKTCIYIYGVSIVIAIFLTATATYFSLNFFNSTKGFENINCDTERLTTSLSTTTFKLLNESKDENIFMPTNTQAVANRIDSWVPEHYYIIIEPNVDSSSNNGSVTIEVKVNVSFHGLQPIVIDVMNVEVSNVSVKQKKTNSSKEDKLIFKSEYGVNNDTYLIHILEQPFDINEKIVLRMDFVSRIHDTSYGVYKTYYRNEGTEIEWIISTQFSPIHARRAFPCFDDPDKKANFTISIIRRNNFSMSLSNMPLSNSSLDRPGFIRDTFFTSPKMSTYLLAFVISNLTQSEIFKPSENLHRNLRIWTRKENGDMTFYAYSTAMKLLQYYEQYFDFQNPLPKIDLVALPELEFNAMENWGLIYFRDSSILVPNDVEKATSTDQIISVSQIIAHELAHQWFGNLVTPKKWDDVWLKEGVASYISYLALSDIFPEYNIMEYFAIYEFKEAMQYDNNNHSHEILFNIRQNDIRQMFDPITYSKSVILFRMFSYIIGEKAFQSGMQNLLKDFSYKTIVHSDFIRYMAKQDIPSLPHNIQIEEVLDSWISKQGYPIITVERFKADILLTQEHFMSTKKKSNLRWIIPISIETDSILGINHKSIYWMTENDHQFVIKNVFITSNNSDNIVYLNPDRQSYYRINYDVISWLALKKKFNSLPRVTRAQLLDDALQLANANFLTYDIPLTFLMELFTATDDQLLWSASQQGINFLLRMVQNEPAYETFRAFMKFIVRPAFERYGLNEPDNEAPNQLLHRALVAKYACKFNYDRCTMAAHRKFREWMTDPKLNSIKPNLKSIIYCTALAEGSFQEWYFAYKQYKRSASDSERNQILAALGCTTKPWLLSKLLNMTVNKSSGLSKHDSVRAFQAVAENPIGLEMAFDFLQINIREIITTYGEDSTAISGMIRSLSSQMNKVRQKEQLQRFSNSEIVSDLFAVKSVIDWAVEEVDINIYWRNNLYIKLKDFLEAIVSEFHINLF